MVIRNESIGYKNKGLVVAIYVDRASIQFRDKIWCHMMADTLEELHQFAQQLNIDARLFHRVASYPHYDITLEMRVVAIVHGAIDADRRTIIECGRRLKLQLALETHIK